MAILNEEEAALDPYVVLGVERTATEKEIRKAFRTMSLKCHPDKNSSEAAAIQFRQLSVSQEILTDASKRAFINTNQEAKRANKERYDKMHKKRQSGIDDLVAREQAAKKARLDRAAATVQLYEENEIKEQGRKMREEAQKRAYAAARPVGPTPVASHSNGDTKPEITASDLTLSLQFPPSSTEPHPDKAESSSQALQNALTVRYGPIALVLLNDPSKSKKTNKKVKGKKAVVEFADGNWGGCWACWRDHQLDQDGQGREIVKGLKVDWMAGEPRWVAWAEKRRKAEKEVPTFTFDASTSAPLTAAPPSAAFESETLFRMRQLDRQRAIERQALAAQILASEERDE